jgi:hypothetical protein
LVRQRALTHLVVLAPVSLFAKVVVIGVAGVGFQKSS